MAKDDLGGWKQIADYLGTSVRTAQRYEQELGLPVRRLPAPASGVSADRAELDEWKANALRSAETRAALTSGEGEEDGGAAASEGPEENGRTVRARRPLVMLLVAAAAIVLLLAWAWLPEGAPAAPATAKALSPVLDPGPWPTNGHDMQRTNQGHLRGPRAPGTPRVLYELPGEDDMWWDLAVTADGRVTFGGCGFVASIDGNGRELWKEPIHSYSGLEVRPGGFAAAATGLVFFTAFDCDGGHDIVQSHLRLATAEGAIAVVRDIGSSFHAPALAPDLRIFTIDDINFVRCLKQPTESVWGTTLAGFHTGGLALDDSGNIIVGTDGSRYNQPSLWSLAPDGKVRWKALDVEVGQAVVGPDRLYVASATGKVYAFSLDGDQLWSRQVGPIGSLQPLALAASGTLYVRTSKDLVALDPDGGVKWRFGSAPAVPRFARPLLDRDETIYLGLNGEVVALTPDGRERWRVAVPQPRNIVFGGEGLLYVTSADKKLYAVGEAK